MSAPAWGPSYRQPRPQRGGGPLWFRLLMSGLLLLWYWEDPTVPGALVILGGGLALAVLIQMALGVQGEQSSPTSLIAGAEDPLQALRSEAARLGGGVYLGTDERGSWRLVRPERAVLVLGPPDPVSHCPLRVRHCANSPASE